MADVLTFAVYDTFNGVSLQGIPSLDAARSVITDFYRQPAEWADFIGAVIPKQEVVFGFEDGCLMFGHDTDDRFFGAVVIERRCGCCGHVTERRPVTKELCPQELWPQKSAS